MTPRRGTRAGDIDVCSTRLVAGGALALSSVDERPARRPRSRLAAPVSAAPPHAHIAVAIPAEAMPLHGKAPASELPPVLVDPSRGVAHHQPWSCRAAPLMGSGLSLPLAPAWRKHAPDGIPAEREESFAANKPLNRRPRSPVDTLAAPTPVMEPPRSPPPTKVAADSVVGHALQVPDLFPMARWPRVAADSRAGPRRATLPALTLQGPLQKD